jgi:hypothetical protein
MAIQFHTFVTSTLDDEANSQADPSDRFTQQAGISHTRFVRVRLAIGKVMLGIKSLPGIEPRSPMSEPVIFMIDHRMIGVR